MEVISECLDIFCASSGQKISKDKTRIFFSKNVHHVQANDQISSAFCLTLTNDLGKYLGVPLHHSRVKADSFNYITKKIMHRLSSWKASSLSLAGRLTLCKSIVLAIPTYAMQTSLLPKKVCDSMDSLCRHFLWGVGDGNHKVHLVAWDKVCHPNTSSG